MHTNMAANHVRKNHVMTNFVIMAMVPRNLESKQQTFIIVKNERNPT